MSITIQDLIDQMIIRKFSVEQCYNEILNWDESVHAQGKAYLTQKQQEDCFDKIIKYRNTTFINPTDPKQIPLGSLLFMSSIKKNTLVQKNI